jgi:ABC-type amino acid transport system permease subunit
MPQKTKADLFQFAFTSVEAEYKDLSETWKLLDSKAQANTAIAGIFLAAAFTFVRNANPPLTSGLKWFLLLTVVALVASIVLALLAMLVRTVPSLPPSEQAASMVTEILEMPETELDDRYDGLVSDTVNAWLPVNGELQAANSKKASWLAASQWSLMVAGALIACITLVALFGQ